MKLKNIPGLLPAKSIYKDWGGETYNEVIDSIGELEVEIDVSMVKTIMWGCFGDIYDEQAYQYAANKILKECLIKKKR